MGGGAGKRHLLLRARNTAEFQARLNASDLHQAVQCPVVFGWSELRVSPLQAATLASKLSIIAEICARLQALYKIRVGRLSRHPWRLLQHNTLRGPA